jgi:hypothetical protein
MRLRALSAILVWALAGIAEARVGWIEREHSVTDSQGRMLVGRNPFTPRGSLSGEHFGELVAIVRIRKNGATHFGYLESRVFNLAYWRGEHELADHTLRIETLAQTFRRRAVHKP